MNQNPSDNANTQISKPENDLTCPEELKQIIRNEIREGFKKEGKEIEQIYQQEYFSGPLPNPETLNEYESIQPGLVDRIVKMAENQSSHRQKIEKTVVNDPKRGQIFAFIISMSFLIAGFTLIWFDKSNQGLITLLGSLVPLVSAFIYKKKEDKNKSEK